MGVEKSLRPAAAAPPRPDALIGMKDDEFEPHTWEDAKNIIASDRLDLLDRWPSDAARYTEWSSSIRQSYGSVTNFICSERLHWKPLPEAKRGQLSSLFAYRSAVPFEVPSDYKILRNDWPYRWEAGMTHICVWLKNRIPVDEATGKVTAEGKSMIDQFVAKTFHGGLGSGGEGKILWFKNWTALQSVSALEHFHVLVRDVPEGMIAEWTGMDTTIHDSETYEKGRLL